MLQRLQLNYAVRSLDQQPGIDTEVYLADTLGELTAFMQHAAVVIMDGSFEGTGGHNLHEPARLGCAIITGPSDSNIREDIDWLQSGKGIIQVPSMQQAWQQTGKLLDNPKAAEKLGTHASERSNQKAGVLPRYIDAIDTIIAR